MNARAFAVVAELCKSDHQGGTSRFDSERVCTRTVDGGNRPSVPFLPRVVERSHAKAGYLGALDGENAVVSIIG